MQNTDSVALAQARTLAAFLARSLQAELIETHLSWVLLVGSSAWKIKKPVHFSFVDATALATRQHFCEEELRLNRRLAPSLYLGVVPITGTPEAPVPTTATRFPVKSRLAPRLLLGSRGQRPVWYHGPSKV